MTLVWDSASSIQLALGHRRVVPTGMWFSKRTGAIRSRHRHGGHCREPCPWVPLYIDAEGRMATDLEARLEACEQALRDAHMERDMALAAWRDERRRGR